MRDEETKYASKDFEDPWIVSATTELDKIFRINSDVLKELRNPHPNVLNSKKHKKTPFLLMRSRSQKNPQDIPTLPDQKIKATKHLTKAATDPQAEERTSCQTSTLHMVKGILFLNKKAFLKNEVRKSL